MKFIRNTNYDVIKGKISLGVLFSLSYVISSVAKKARIVSASWNLFGQNQAIQKPVSWCYAISVALSLQSHYFLYQLLKCLKESVTQ
jgi:ABC-type Mn2+/Zn2+ transport system permease subunit